ncbi:MAG: metalloregulator ArsR/SmtB family transcription factor [Spirochaetes bacterium]|jgi:DNA-binding transcriptional ArsR family regulator|nr:metalloregulator ArsR/SmtB family transcription factor [Spirochaetota bacterium]
MDQKICDVYYVHKGVVKTVEKKISDEGELFMLAEFFKVYGDATRIKILQALSVSRLCVCDIAKLVNSSQSAVSHQLALLRKGMLVKTEREGRSVFYSLNDEHIKKILSMGLEHIREGVKR